MFPNVPAFPGKHRHGPNSSTYLRRDIEQIGIDLAAIQQSVEEFLLVRCQFEERSKPVSADRNGFLYPCIDIPFAGKAVAREADRELLTELTRVTFDGVD